MGPNFVTGLCAGHSKLGETQETDSHRHPSSMGPSFPEWIFFVGCEAVLGGLVLFDFVFFLLTISDQDGSLKREDSPVEPHENGVDVDNDDELPIMGDLDGMDGDPNDMNRPRKIRR